MNEEEHPESQTHQLDSAHQAELAQRVEQDHQEEEAALTTVDGNQEDHHQVTSEQPHPELPPISITNPPLGAPASEPVTSQDNAMVQDPQAQTSLQERNEFISSYISDIISAVTSKLDSDEESKEKPGDAQQESEAAVATNDSKESDEAMADEEAAAAEEALGAAGGAISPESSTEAEAQIPSAVSPSTGGTQEDAEMASEEQSNQIGEQQQTEPHPPESCLQEIIEAYNQSSAAQQADTQTRPQEGDITTGMAEPSLDQPSQRMGPSSSEMQLAFKNVEQALLKSATDKPVSGPFLKRMKPVLNLLMNEMQARSQAREQNADGSTASTAQPQFAQVLLKALQNLQSAGSQPEGLRGDGSEETHLPQYGEVQESPQGQVDQKIPEEALPVQDPADPGTRARARQVEDQLSQPKPKFKVLPSSQSSLLVLPHPDDELMAETEGSSLISPRAEESETSQEAMRILNYLKTLECQEKIEKEMRASGGLLPGNSPVQGPGSMAAGDSTSVRSEPGQAQASRSPPTIAQQPTQTQLPSQPGAAASNQPGGNQAAATSSNVFLTNGGDEEDPEQEEEDKDLGDEDTDDEDDLIIVQADTQEYAELGTPTLGTEADTGTEKAAGAATGSATGDAAGAATGAHIVARSNINPQKHSQERIRNTAILRDMSQRRVTYQRAPCERINWEIEAKQSNWSEQLQKTYYVLGSLKEIADILLEQRLTMQKPIAISMMHLQKPVYDRTLWLIVYSYDVFKKEDFFFVPCIDPFKHEVHVSFKLPEVSKMSIDELKFMFPVNVLIGVFLPKLQMVKIQKGLNLTVLIDNPNSFAIFSPKKTPGQVWVGINQARMLKRSGNIHNAYKILLYLWKWQIEEENSRHLDTIFDLLMTLLVEYQKYEQILELLNSFDCSRLSPDFKSQSRLLFNVCLIALNLTGDDQQLLEPEDDRPEVNEAILWKGGGLLSRKPSMTWMYGDYLHSLLKFSDIYRNEDECMVALQTKSKIIKGATLAGELSPFFTGNFIPSELGKKNLQYMAQALSNVCKISGPIAEKVIAATDQFCLPREDLFRFNETEIEQDQLYQDLEKLEFNDYYSLLQKCALSVGENTWGGQFMLLGAYIVATPDENEINAEFVISDKQILLRAKREIKAEEYILVHENQLGVFENLDGGMEMPTVFK